MIAASWCPALANPHAEMPSGVASAQSTAMSRWPSIACSDDWRNNAIVTATMATRTITSIGVAAPDCEVGTIPPVGDLFSVRVLADIAVREDPEITFHAGSHHFTVHVDRPGWERAGGVTYADLADARDRGPAWAR